MIAVSWMPLGVLMLVAASACAPSAPADPPRPTALQATATAYCQSGTTKSGEETRRGVIAADPAFLPLGSVVRIDAPQDAHDGVYQVLDTGGAVKGSIVDIYMTNCRSAERFGRRDVTLHVVEWGPTPADAAVGTTGQSAPAADRRPSK